MQKLMIIVTQRYKMKKRKMHKNLEFIDQKDDPKNDENAINFRWSDIRGEDEEGISKLTWLRVYKSKLMKRFYPKKSN